MKWLRKNLIGIIAILVLVYLFIPIFVIMVLSFNNPKGKFNLSWNEFSLDAWTGLCDVPGVCSSFVTSIQIGIIGISIASRRPVLADIVDYAPATLELALCAALLALGLGIPMGVYAGIKRNAWGAQLMQVVAAHGGADLDHSALVQALERMAGTSATPPLLLKAQTTTDLKKRPGRREFQRGLEVVLGRERHRVQPVRAVEADRGELVAAGVDQVLEVALEKVPQALPDDEV